MQRELFAIVLLYLASECHAVHWYFKLGQQRCVMKDVDGGITVTGNYRIEVFDSDIGAYTHRPFGYGIQVSVYDGHGKEMLNRVYSTSGEKFQFYAEREDRHVVCLRPNITTAPHGHAPYRMYLRFEPSSYDYMTGERLEELKKGIARYFKHLLNATQTIRTEQNDVRSREERFRVTSESTNSRIFMWMFAQLVVGVLICLLQATHLKAFIVKKKLV